MEEGFNINNVISNNDIEVVYTPSSNCSYYRYKIFLNDELIKEININSNDFTTFVLSDEGQYNIIVVEFNADDVEITSNNTTYTIDKTAPIINIKNKTSKIKSGDSFNYFSEISCIDNFDGDITKNIKTNIDEINFNTSGIKKIEFNISDKAGNVTTDFMYVTVLKNDKELIYLGQVSIIFIVLLVFIFLFKYIRSLKLEKRFSKYTINSSKNKSISLFDYLYNSYLKVEDKFSMVLKKSDFISNVSKRYEKYVDTLELKSKYNVIANKIFIGLFYLFVIITVRLLKSSIVSPLEMIIPFLIGYYLLDFVYIYKYFMYKKRIENDLLEAITLMNNAFKAGNSITQAIDLVSLEMSGPISKEFKRVSKEISLGLDIEIAFNRFAERIKIKEAVYLTSSLSVLSKTGGNIIKVFDSIEKTLFGMRRLQVELKSLTSSSRLIMYVLLLVPIIFAIFINVANKDYFKPLFTNPLGLLLMGIMVVIYIAYIIVVRKVMKIRM